MEFCDKNNDLYKYSYSEAQLKPSKSYLEYQQINVLYNLIQNHESMFYDANEQDEHFTPST